MGKKVTKKNAKNERKKQRRNPALFYVFGFSVFGSKMAFHKSTPGLNAPRSVFRLPAKFMCTPLCTISKSMFSMIFKIDFLINASFVEFYAQISGSRTLFRETREVSGS